MARRRYQRGTIRKRGNRIPIWELSWWEDYIKPDGSIGRRRASKILGSAEGITKRQAMKAAEEFLRPLNQGRLTPVSTILFREFIENYFVPNVFPTLKLSTQKRYQITLNKHLLPAFGHRRLCDIGTLEIQQFVLKKMEAGLSWECCDHFRNLISKVFTMAKKWGYHSAENPAAGVELPERRTVREKHALTPDQISGLLVLLREPVRTMVAVALFTGVRIGELLGLRWSDVDLIAGKLRISQACYRGIIGTPKTQGSRRTLHLPESLVTALLRFRESSPGTEDQLVFRTRNHTPLNDTNLLHRFLKPAGKLIGAPWLGWHTLRRTHATLLLVSGATPKETQTQLGHSRISTTMEIYAQNVPAHQQLAVERLSQLVDISDEFRPNAKAVPPSIQ
jgi:integrase